MTPRGRTLQAKFRQSTTVLFDKVISANIQIPILTCTAKTSHHLQPHQAFAAPECSIPIISLPKYFPDTATVMPRLDLAEIHEQSWFPSTLRDAVTDVLQFLLNWTGYEQTVAPVLRDALDRAQASRVVDLCSGGGGPWPNLVQLLSKERNIGVCLTDKFPNVETFRRILCSSRGQIKAAIGPVDAESLPVEFSGFRTLFNSFHHFEPSRARAILQDAVERGQGVGIFEVPRRAFAAICATPLMALGALFVTPFTCRFDWRLLVCTYLIPVVPIVLWIDGLLSCLRSYTPDELRQLCDTPDLCSHRWSVGTIRHRFSPVTITYLIGHPNPTAVTPATDDCTAALKVLPQDCAA